MCEHCQQKGLILLCFVVSFFFFLTGTCSSAQTEAIPQLQPETSVSCLLSFTSDAVDFAVSDVLKSHVSFDTSIGKVQKNTVLIM